MQFLIAFSGCYYTHLAVGQSRLLLARESLQKAIEDPSTPLSVRHRLSVVVEVLEFGNELGLNVGKRYRQFVDWPGDRIITAVMATKRNTMEQHQFKFPLVGALPYKGFFDQQRAQGEATSLEARGYDTCIFPVPAYSTLGWFEDPVTGPMVRMGDYELIQTVLHELVHATVFVPENVDFNESFATFFSQEAMLQFETHFPVATHFEERLETSRKFDQKLSRFREEVIGLYRENRSPLDRKRERNELEERFRKSLAGSSLSTEGIRDLRLNDACLALARTYSSDFAKFSSILNRLKGDLRVLLRLAIEAEDSKEPLKYMEMLVKAEGHTRNFSDENVF